MAQSPELVSITKAQLLGFNDLSYDTQRIVFSKARMFQWTGKEPGVLGSHSANKVLDKALDFLLEQGVIFHKEGNGR